MAILIHGNVPSVAPPGRCLLLLSLSLCIVHKYIWLIFFFQGWSSWTNWTPCTKSCGTGGHKERTRWAAPPASHFCGQKCPNQMSLVPLPTGTAAWITAIRCASPMPTKTQRIPGWPMRSRIATRMSVQVILVNQFLKVFKKSYDTLKWFAFL